MNSPGLPVPLYHGTSTLFLDGILRHGLGAKNPVIDLRLLEFIAELRPLLDANLAETAIYKTRSTSFALMAEQASSGLNFQHGHTYLSPSSGTAIRYAANKRYGSELLTYALDFLQALLDRDVPTVADRLFACYPSIFACLDVSPAPIIIRVDRVPVQSLMAESGAPPGQHVSRIIDLHHASPDHFQMLAQQLNFRLVAPLPPTNVRAWFINVIKWHPFKPEYTLYQLVPNAPARDEHSPSWPS